MHSALVYACIGEGKNLPIVHSQSQPLHSGYESCSGVSDGRQSQAVGMRCAAAHIVNGHGNSPQSSMQTGNLSLPGRDGMHESESVEEHQGIF